MLYEVITNLSIAIKSPLGSFMACFFIAMLSFSFVSVYNSVTKETKFSALAIEDASRLNEFYKKLVDANSNFSQSIILTNINEDKAIRNNFV